jgi:hypothetical protein
MISAAASAPGWGGNPDFLARQRLQLITGTPAKCHHFFFSKRTSVCTDWGKQL